jgi:hypothetical protein
VVVGTGKLPAAGYSRVRRGRFARFHEDNRRRVRQEDLVTQESERFLALFGLVVFADSQSVRVPVTVRVGRDVNR